MLDYLLKRSRAFAFLLARARNLGLYDANHAQTKLHNVARIVE